MSNLPSREEYIEKLKTMTKISTSEWNRGLYRCPRCNGEVKRDYSQMVMSNPPRYRYFCRSCQFEEVL